MQSRSNSRMEKSSLTITARREEKQHISSTEAGHKDPLFVGETPLRKNNHQEEKICRMQFQDSQQRNETFSAIETSSSSSQGSSECFIPEEENGCSRIVEIGNQREPQTCSDAPITEQQNFYKDVMNELMKLRQELETERGMRRKLENKISRQSKKIKELKVKTPSQEDTLKTPPIQLKIEAVTTLDDSNSSNACSPPNYSGDDAEEIKPELCDESPTEDAALSPNGLNLQKSTLNSQTNMNTIQTPVTDYERMQSSGRQGCKEKSLTKHNLPAFDDSASHAKNKDNGSRKRKISEKQLRTSSGSNLKKLKNSSEICAFSSSSLITSREGVNGGILDSEIQLQLQTESTACTEEVEIVDKRTGFILKGIECISEMSKCDSNPPDVNCTKEDGVLSTMSSRIRSITSECKTKNNNKSSLDYSYGCNLCGLKFCGLESLQCHVPCVGSVANKDPLKCGVCSKTFRECVDLERHLQGLCSNEHFECEVCSKNCASKLCLAWHMQMHVDVEPENRANQSKTFLTKESQASQRSSECTICNKRFFSKLCLQSHMKQHKGNEVELLSGVSDDCQLENLVIPEESSDCQEPVNSSFYATLDINKSLTAHLISKDAELQEQNSTRHCDRERSLWSLFDQDTLFRDSGSNLPTDLNQKKTNHQQNLSSVGIFECMSSKIAPGQKQTTELICAQEISSEITKTYRPYCVKCWNTFKDLKAMEEHARFCNESCHDSNTRAMIPSNISECIIIKSEDRPRSSERVLENGSKEITLKRFGAVVGNGSVDVAKSNTFEELRIGSDTRDISNLHVSVEEKAMNGLDQVPHCESHDWPKNSLYGLPRREPNDLASMLYVLSKNAANDLANSESDDLAESFSEQVANIESYLANSESGLLDMNGSDKVANEKSDDVVKNGSDESGEDMSREVTKIFLGKVTKSRPSELISCGSDEFLASHFIDSAKSGSQKLTKNVLHEESNCTSDNALHCLNCQKIFSSRHKLNKHMELHKVFGSSLRCNHCKHKFTLLDSLQEHTCQAYTIEGPQFRCPDCEESFKISLHLKNHMSEVHSVEQPFKCKRCGKQYEKFCQWNQHVQGHRTDRHYVCNKCGCRYKFLHHLKREHLPCLSNSTKLKCPKCNQKFMKASRLRLHVALCQNERAVKCRVCYQLFAKQSKLDKHMCRHIDERPYQCPQCDKCFIFHEDLIRHVHRHSIEKSYICVVCNKAFMGKASLLSHLKIHTTSRKTCSSGSKINGMSSEVQVNTKERQMPKGLYGCGLCGCLYITMISLRRHLPCEGGAGEKDPFFCGECNKKFCEENELEKHVASKTKKPFSCRHCSKCFLHSSSLKRHLETVHLGSLKYAAENKNLHNKCQSDANLKSQKSLSTAGTDDALYCMNCCKTFSSHEQLNKHLELRTCMAYSVVGPQFRCPECEESFKIRWQFKNHMSKVHSIEQNFKCKHCGKQYDNFSLWNKHVQAHRTDRCYVCNKCGKGFKHLRNLKDDHLPCLTDSADLKCPKCNHVFERASELRRHVRLCKNDRAVKCLVCHRLFHNQLKLDKHLGSHTDEKPYLCLQCDERFIFREDLLSHVHRHSDEKSYVCVVCDKAFGGKASLLSHLKIHTISWKNCSLGSKISGMSSDVEMKGVEKQTAKRFYGCGLCGCLYIGMVSLKRHLPCEGGASEDPFFCGDCNEKFVDANELEKHVLGVHSKNFICSICSKMFVKKLYLKQHIMDSHTDEKPYKCKQCGREFKHSLQLRYHLPCYVSPGSDIQCNLCPMTFCKISQLRTHISINHNSKAVQCDVCAKILRDRQALDVHLKIHANNRRKPYSCTHCSKSFFHTSSLRRHIETVHLDPLKCDAEIKNVNCTYQSHNSPSTAGTDDTLCCLNCFKTFSSHQELNKHMEQHKQFGSSLRCSRCKQKFSLLDSIQGHTCQAYTIEGPQFRCPECEECFEISWQFKNHVSEVHSMEQHFKCKHCGKQYDKFCQWNSHVQAHRTDRRYVCNKCGKSFKHLHHLRSDHLPCLSNSAALKCPKCSQGFARASRLRRHVRLCQNERAVNCRVCHRLFHSQLGLDRHKCCLTGENPYQCPQCGKCFSCRKGLVSHTHNHSTEKPYVCDVCGKAFAVRRAFLEHSKIHVNAKEKCGLGINITGVSNQVEKKKKRKQLEKRFYGCGLCGCLYLSMISLKQHLPCEEGGTGEKGPFFCGGCNKTFCEENELEKHVISVHSENLFSCSVCNKMFARKLSLKLHMQSHTGERPFKCKLCDETFKQRAHLKYHLPCYASPGSDIRCDQCQMTFDKITKLRTHVSINHSSSAVQCEVCGKKLSSRTGLDIHLKSHANKSKEERQKPYSCRRCSKCFVHSSSLMRHLETAHLEPLKCGSENKNPDSKYQYDITLKSDILPIISGTDDILYCPSCHKTFSSQHLLNKHLELHKKFGSSLSCSHCKQKFTLLDSIQGHTCQAYSIEGPQFRCPECEESFEISQPLKKHMSEVHSVEQPFKCKRCGKQYEKFCQWNSHVQDHRTDRHYVCNKCGKKYKYLHHLKCDHLPCLSESAELKCPKCNEEFRKATQLRTHVTLCQNVRAVKCQVCQRLFHNQKKLDKHMCCHMREKPYQCPQCDKCFSSCKYLMYHVQCHSDSKPYVCDVCGKGFEAEAFLRKHSNIHMSDPPYKCNECDMSFIYACHLRDHKDKVHGGVKKRFACSICNKSFFSKSYLNAHMCSHTGQNPHLCSVCGKGFREKQLLKYHMRVHTGEKPYACKYCYRRFRMPRSMRNHERVHTGEKPYECTICGMKFPQSSYLKNHSKKAHMAE